MENRTLAEVEKEHIIKVLEACGGNRTHAALALKIGVRTLQRRLKEWGAKTYLKTDLPDKVDEPYPAMFGFDGE